MNSLNSNRTHRWIALAAVMFLDLVSASGAVWFVATNGNNSTGNGSIGNPWADIRYGVLQMSGGDTLNIRGGTYPLYLYLLQEFDSGPNPSTPTIIQAYQGETVVYAPGTNVPGQFFHGLLLSSKSNIVLNGWQIDARNCTSDGIKIDGTSRFITLTNMTVFGCGTGHGLLTSSQNQLNGLVTHCRFLTNGWDGRTNLAPLHQIYLQSSSVTVEYCTIQGVTNVGGGTLGIHAFGEATTNGVYRNNFITNCSTGIGILGRDMVDHQIYNNIIVGGYSWGISVYQGSSIRVLNNTCYTNAGGINFELATNIWAENNICVGAYASFVGGIGLDNVHTASVQNNLAYGNFYGAGLRSSDYVNRNDSVNITTNGNMFGTEGVWGNVRVNGNFDARFANPVASDFHLLDGSDAIRRAKAQSFFTTDYGDNPRGPTTWSIGAWEYRLDPPTGLRVLTSAP